MTARGDDPTDTSRLARFFELSSQLFAVIDREGRVATVNPAFVRALGYQPSDLRGRAWTEFVHPDDRYGVEEKLSRLSTTNTAEVPITCRCAHKRGTWVALRWSLSRNTHDSETFAIAEESSGRSLASELLARVFRLCPVPMVIASAHGVILEVNDSFEAITGRSRSDSVGHQALEFTTVDEATRTRITQELSAKGQIRGEELSLRVSDGSLKTVSLSVEVAEIEDRRLVIAAIVDVSERVAAARELREKSLALEASARAEEATQSALGSVQSALMQTEKLASLGQLVAGVAHEINNPLAFVANNLAVLRRDVAATRALLKVYEDNTEAIGRALPRVAEAAQRHALEIDWVYIDGNLWGLFDRTEKGIERIKKIVESLRVFARVEGQGHAEEDINAGISSTLELCEGRMRDRGVTLNTELGEVPLVMCQAVGINQVVLNLVHNAVDASPRGSVVTVRSGCEEGFVTIEVEDQGTGIETEVASRIFDPFFTTKPVGEGTGLGLSVSYGIVKEHRGLIEVASRRGQGTKFTVKLPRHR